jgi:hypothetical protein
MRPTGQKIGPTCFTCSHIGHYANACPAGNSSASTQNKQQNPDKGFSIARVNQVSVEATIDGAYIAIGMFYINAIPATLFLILELCIRLCLLNLPPLMNYHSKT